MLIRAHVLQDSFYSVTQIQIVLTTGVLVRFCNNNLKSPLISSYSQKNSELLNFISKRRPT